MAALNSTLLAAAALLLATLQAQPAVADEAPASAANAFQMTVGSADDFPGATGMAYRYLDASPLGGWVVGGWAQGASAIARVGANGSVIWSHRLHYNFSDHPWPCADPKGKIHRVDPDFGSSLTVSNRDSQSNCWVNFKIVGQPCEFQVCGSSRSLRKSVSLLGGLRQILCRLGASWGARPGVGRNCWAT